MDWGFLSHPHPPYFRYCWRMATGCLEITTFQINSKKNIKPKMKPQRKTKPLNQKQKQNHHLFIHLHGTNQNPFLRSSPNDLTTPCDSPPSNVVKASETFIGFPKAIVHILGGKGGKLVTGQPRKSREAIFTYEENTWVSEKDDRMCFCWCVFPCCTKDFPLTKSRGTVVSCFYSLGIAGYGPSFWGDGGIRLDV